MVQSHRVSSSLPSTPYVVGSNTGGDYYSCHAAMMDPAAFTATIFIEPILFQMEATTKAIAGLALKRRDRWESK